MIPIDLPPKLWLPPKPAIIRPAARQPELATFPFPVFVPAAGAPAIAVAYISTATSTVSGASHTFTGQAIGGAAADRIVVAHVASASSAALTGVTIGGVSAAIGASTTGTSTRTTIAYLLVPAGTTATIVATFGSSVPRCHISVLRLTGYASGTPTDSDQPAGGAMGSRSITIDAPAGGAVVFGAMGTELAFPMTITNATKLNELTDGSNDTATVGSYVTVGGTETNRVITANPCRCICGVAWA